MHYPQSNLFRQSLGPPEFGNRGALWHLCDFKTSQSPLRMGSLNMKSTFIRDRRPKLAAHRVRELWQR